MSTYALSTDIEYYFIINITNTNIIILVNTNTHTHIYIYTLFPASFSYQPCCIATTMTTIQTHNTYTSTYARRTQRHNKDERHSSLEKYSSHFIWKGCVWEGVGDRTELQRIDPHSIGHNRVSFPFSWAAQPGAWGPTLLGAGFLYRILSPTVLVSKLTDFLSSPSYIIVPVV